MTVPLLLDFLALPENTPATPFPGTSHRTSPPPHAMQSWERLCLLRREIASLRSWMRDATPHRAHPSRWVVESRLQQLTEEAERLAAESARPRHPARVYWDH